MINNVAAAAATRVMHSLAAVIVVLLLPAITVSNVSSTSYKILCMHAVSTLLLLCYTEQ
jgi:hypothetical protein